MSLRELINNNWIGKAINDSSIGRYFGYLSRGDFSRLAPVNLEPKVTKESLPSLLELGLYTGPNSLCNLPERYIPLKFLGSGGLGKVYLAWDEERSTYVAIKTTEHDEIFEREMTAGKKIKENGYHINILEILDNFPEENLLVMDFCNGNDLYTSMEGERLSLKQTLAITTQICEALQYTHNLGIIHRDVKVDNILLSISDLRYLDEHPQCLPYSYGLLNPDRKLVTAKLADFGISRCEETKNLDLPGQNIGTPTYMPPESIITPGDKPTFDIYSMGLTIYFMLTGRHVFPALGSLAALQAKKLEGPVKYNGSIPHGAMKVIQTATEVNPLNRYQSMTELAEDMAGIFD
jgi:eukaryotic-like serine/threonine-protein kinase